VTSHLGVTRASGWRIGASIWKADGGRLKASATNQTAAPSNNRDAQLDAGEVGDRRIVERARLGAEDLAVPATIAGTAAVISVSTDRTSAQAPPSFPAAPAPAAAPKTPWGEPDLQGIWTDENDTPLQRPAKYASQEFFTPAQRAQLDEACTAVLVNADKSRAQGTSRDVAGAYNSQFVSFKRTGARTSLIVDPPDSRIPPLTPAAQKIAAAEREFRLALLRATDTCRDSSRLAAARSTIRCPRPDSRQYPPLQCDRDQSP
jgi:hypothetical protein